MKKEISPKLKLSRMLSLFLLLSGSAFIVFMITREGEPGALPLFLMLTGIMWFIATSYMINKQQKK